MATRTPRGKAADIEKAEPDYSQHADGIRIARDVKTVTLSEELGTDFLKYSIMTLRGRAIPDVRDGMKPVHKRIIYAMYKAGFTPDKGTHKCALCVGEVMKYHPNGDAGIYGALVRLGRWYSLNTLLITKQGSFGPYTGDTPAASRYTEAKLSPAAMLCLDDLKYDVEQMVMSPVGELMEPKRLPVRFPNLIINGSEGIGVGITSAIPPHNPTEAIAAAKWMLTHPNMTVDKLLDIMPGPDFPTGCDIIGKDGIRSAYETGRGIILMRAKAEIEQLPRGKHDILFTGFPYEVSIPSILDDIKKKISDGKLEGIADYKDLSDRHAGMRMTVTTKPGVNPKVLLSRLYALTGLETSYGIIMYVLDGQNVELYGMLEMLRKFVDFRREVVHKRIEFLLARNESRMHLLDGLLTCLANIDEVIAIVRKSKDRETAKRGLERRFKIDEYQSEYVVRIPLGRLTRYDSIQLRDEAKELKGKNKEYNAILADPKLLDKEVARELSEVEKVIRQDRKSHIVDADVSEHKAALADVVENSAVEIPDVPCLVSMSANGDMLWRTDWKEARGGHVLSLASGKRSSAGYPRSSYLTTTLSEVLLVTSKGRSTRVRASDLMGRPSAPHMALGSGETVVAAIPLTVGEDGRYATRLGMVTASGMVKTFECSSLTKAPECDVIGLDAGDSLVACQPLSDASRFALVASNANLLTFDASLVRPQGRTGHGVAGIKLGSGDALVFGGIVDPTSPARVVTSTGKSAKMSDYSEFPTKGRATGGVRSHRFVKGEERLTWAYVGNGDIHVDTSMGELTFPKALGKRDGSGTKLSGEPTWYAAGRADVPSYAYDEKGKPVA